MLGSNSPAADSATFFKNTRQSAIFATGLLNRLSGGSDRRAGLIDIHPNTLQYLSHQYAGGPIEFLMSSVEAGARGIKGEFDPNKTPFVRQIFRKGKPSQWSYRTIFDTLEIAAKKDLSQMQKDRFYRAVDTGLKEEVYPEKTANGYIQDFIKAQEFITGNITDNIDTLIGMEKEDSDRLIGTYADSTQKRLRKEMILQERRK